MPYKYDNNGNTSFFLKVPSRGCCYGYLTFCQITDNKIQARPLNMEINSLDVVAAFTVLPSDEAIFKYEHGRGSYYICNLRNKNEPPQKLEGLKENELKLDFHSFTHKAYGDMHDIQLSLNPECTALCINEFNGRYSYHRLPELPLSSYISSTTCLPNVLVEVITSYIRNDSRNSGISEAWPVRSPYPKEDQNKLQTEIHEFKDPRAKHIIVFLN
jgi:hypothetical protein